MVKRYEYKTLITRLRDDDKLVLTHVDNKRIAKLDSPLGVSYTAWELHSYLAEAGLQGWEVISSSQLETRVAFLLMRRELM
jgi:hypothetical protein